jgi:hypothetical protein
MGTILKRSPVRSSSLGRVSSPGRMVRMSGMKMSSRDGFFQRTDDLKKS